MYYLKFLAGLLTVLVAFQSRAGETFLLPDISLTLICSENSISPAAVQSFIRQENMMAVDVMAERQSKGLPAMQTNLFVYGFNSAGDLVSFTQGFPNHYSIDSYSPPPTVRHPQFENKLIEFVASFAGCKISKEARHENPVEREQIYRKFFFDRTGKEID
jgi:hypothetical protein